jgi:hypothetical protein
LSIDIGAGPVEALSIDIGAVDVVVSILITVDLSERPINGSQLQCDEELHAAFTTTSNMAGPRPMTEEVWSAIAREVP